MTALKLQRTNDGIGTTFPDELLNQLKLREGDVLQAIGTTDGILLTPVDEDFNAEMEIAERIMAENEAVLRALAK